jgi:hypothetical protein
VDLLRLAGRHIKIEDVPEEDNLLSHSISLSSINIRKSRAVKQNNSTRNAQYAFAHTPLRHYVSVEILSKPKTEPSRPSMPSRLNV